MTTQINHNLTKVYQPVKYGTPYIPCFADTTLAAAALQDIGSVKALWRLYRSQKKSAKKKIKAYQARCLRQMTLDTQVWNATMRRADEIVQDLQVSRELQELIGGEPPLSAEEIARIEAVYFATEAEYYRIFGRKNNDNT